MPVVQRGDSGRFVPAPPPRTPERTRLAEAIQRHANALDRRSRIQEASQRLWRQQYDELDPAVDAAKQALDQAKKRAPAARIDRLLADDQGEDETLAAAESALADAERQLAECRASRDLLAEEAKRVITAVEAAEHALASAVNAVIHAEASALLGAYRAAADRILQLAASLASVGLELPRAERGGFELVVRGAPLNGTKFVPCALWEAIASRLRSDPDALLPGVPPEPADTGAPDVAA